MSGSGDGLVDAAAAGVIDGSELILYSASLGGATELASGDSPSVTGSEMRLERDRWSSPTRTVTVRTTGAARRT